MNEYINDSADNLPKVQQDIQKALYSLQGQDISTLSLESYRAAFDALTMLQTQPDDVRIEPLAIEGLPAEWIIPADPHPEQVILYFHGGTYIHGSLATDRVLASMLARVSRTKILQFAYRLAPEYPFPMAIYDGLHAYQWLLAQGYPPETIGLVGSTAGGGIMLAVLLIARDQGIPLPVITASISPWIDLTAENLAAKRDLTKDIVLNASLLEYAARHYVAGIDPSDPLVSPLFEDLHGLPPLFLQVGQNEILHDDVYRLAKHALDCQVRARCITWGDMFHDWQAFADVVPEGLLALEQIAAYFEKYFSIAKGTWPDTSIIR